MVFIFNHCLNHTVKHIDIFLFCDFFQSVLKSLPYVSFHNSSQHSNQFLFAVILQNLGNLPHHIIHCHITLHAVAALTRQLQILNIIGAATRQRHNVVDCHFLKFDRLTAYRTFSVALGVHALFLKVIELDSVCHTITLSAP